MKTSQVKSTPVKSLPPQLASGRHSIDFRSWLSDCLSDTLRARAREILTAWLALGEGFNTLVW